MYLRTLNVNQFRCFESLRLELTPGITLFHGNNAQGKTSILEAACVLLRLQSPRTSTLAECIQFSQKAFAVGGNLECRNPVELRMQYRETGRKLLVDGENQKSPADFLRQSALVVWMANDDLSLVRGGGEGRRRFLDFMASQIFPGYRQALKSYEKALRSRNFLLKRCSSDLRSRPDLQPSIIPPLFVAWFRAGRVDDPSCFIYGDDLSRSSPP